MCDHTAPWTGGLAVAPAVGRWRCGEDGGRPESPGLMVQMDNQLFSYKYFYVLYLAILPGPLVYEKKS